jgi:hypothetical protein
VKELWQLVKVEPFEIGRCKGCPCLGLLNCPRGEKDPDAVECSPRTSERQALHYLEREIESHGQQEMF